VGVKKFFSYLSTDLSPLIYRWVWVLIYSFLIAYESVSFAEALI